MDGQSASVPTQSSEFSLDVLMAGMPIVPTMEQIFELQRACEQYPNVELRAENFFADGMYARGLFIPGGMIVVGRIHRHEHLVMLTEGSAIIYTDQGMEEVCAPWMWVSPIGAKRALYTHEDCVFHTFHLNPDNCKDEQTLIDRLTISEEEWYRPSEKSS